MEWKMEKFKDFYVSCNLVRHNSTPIYFCSCRNVCLQGCPMEKMRRQKFHKVKTSSSNVLFPDSILKQPSFAERHERSNGVVHRQLSEKKVSFADMIEGKSPTPSSNFISSRKHEQKSHQKKRRRSFCSVLQKNPIFVFKNCFSVNSR